MYCSEAPQEPLCYHIPLFLYLRKNYKKNEKINIIYSLSYCSGKRLDREKSRGKKKQNSTGKKYEKRCRKEFTTRGKQNMIE